MVLKIHFKTQPLLLNKFSWNQPVTLIATHEDWRAVNFLLPLRKPVGPYTNFGISHLAKTFPHLQLQPAYNKSHKNKIVLATLHTFMHAQLDHPSHSSLVRFLGETNEKWKPFVNTKLNESVPMATFSASSSKLSLTTYFFPVVSPQ